MKESELRDAATCGHCGRKIGETGMPFFYRVKIERHALDMAAVQRQQGLGLMIGARLANVMGPDEEMTKLFHASTLTVCENCSTKTLCVAQLVEEGTTDEPA